MTDKKVLQQMRDVLKPKGTAPVVRLFLNDSSYFDQTFIDACINELNIKTAMDEKPSALERLAVHVLCDSAYINSKG